jgi:uncharacterized protein YjlB
METVHKECLRNIFNEGKFPYISYRRKANQVILKESRSKMSLYFAKNALHNPWTNFFFPSHFFPFDLASLGLF